MLQIRPPQVAAIRLSAEMRRELVEHLRELARAYWPQRCVGIKTDELDEWADRAVSAALGWGVSRRADFGRYFNVVMALGWGFEDSPRFAWTRRVLEDEQLAPSTRITRLSALVGSHLALEGELGRRAH